MQLLILYFQLSQTSITELGLLLSRHLTVVIDSKQYPSLRVVFAWKAMSFVSLSVSAWVLVCVNPINAPAVTWLIREAIMVCHVKWNAGKTLRHNYLNDLIYHALLQAGLPLTKQSAGLLRTDGKRPNDFNNMPWQTSKSAVWDVAVTDTLDNFYLASTLMIVAATAELAGIRKEAKYVERSTKTPLRPSSFRVIASHQFQSHEF